MSTNFFSENMDSRNEFVGVGVIKRERNIKWFEVI
jgi:hypothetical protein